MSVLIFKNFIEKYECDQLNQWVELGVKNKYLDYGTNRGSGWEYKKRLTNRAYGNRFEYPEIVYRLFKKITDFLELQHLKKSSLGGGKNGVVVSYTLPGGDVYEHIDKMEFSHHVLRCNIITQAADDGAELFVGGKNIDVAVGDLHCYLASSLPHYVTEVKGNTPRILWMFGYQCPIKEFEFLLKKHTNYALCE
jgi:hypothetical protein